MKRLLDIFSDLLFFSILLGDVKATVMTDKGAGGLNIGTSMVLL